jgi:hypothetical protein
MSAIRSLSAEDRTWRGQPNSVENDPSQNFCSPKRLQIENDLRGTLRNFGLKVGMVGKVKFEARIQELVETFPDLAPLVEPLLIVRRALRLLAIVRDDEVVPAHGA